MQIYDWIVIGGGIIGAALGYELAKQGCSVLLLEKDAELQGASRYSYGGIAFWSGTTELTRQLCAESYVRHQVLSEELGMDTQFRELDLLLTIDLATDPQAIMATYAGVAIPPQLISTQDACFLEPLLNPAAIAAALTVRHGHFLPELGVKAYSQAMQRLGGQLHIESVVGLLGADETLRKAASPLPDRITGVQTTHQSYAAGNVVVCAGALSRQLCRHAGLHIPQYFSQSEQLETPPLDLKLRTLVMPARLQRFGLEAAASKAAVDALWDEPGHEPTPAILDAGAIQFLDGRVRIGQLSRAITSPEPVVTAAESEAKIRAAIAPLLPDLATVTATWHHCLVAFSRDRLPLIGPIPGVEGLHLFTGFSNPLAIFPTLALRFARHVTAQPDDLVQQLLVDRFVQQSTQPEQPGGDDRARADLAR